MKQVWTKKHKEQKSPNVLAMIRNFNKISNWAVREIISRTEQSQRIAVLKHFIQITYECLNLHNLNGVLELCSTLESAAVYRLRRTWQALPKDVSDMFEEIHKLCAAENNYKLLRDKVRRVTPPSIPHLGGFLTELTFLEDSSEDQTEGNLINFNKLRKIAVTILELQSYQSVCHCFTAIPEIQTYLSNVEEITDQVAYELSLKAEPRTT